MLRCPRLANPSLWLPWLLPQALGAYYEGTHKGCPYGPLPVLKGALVLQPQLISCNSLNPQDNLASRVSLCCLLIGLARLGKGEHRVDDGPEMSRINQCANLYQFIAVGSDYEIDKAHVVSPTSLTSPTSLCL